MKIPPKKRQKKPPEPIFFADPTKSTYWRRNRTKDRIYEVTLKVLTNTSYTNPEEWDWTYLVGKPVQVTKVVLAEEE